MRMITLIAAIALFGMAVIPAQAKPVCHGSSDQPNHQSSLSSTTAGGYVCSCD
jgi:hypothetical protein